MSQPLMLKKLKLNKFYEYIQHLLQLTPKMMSFSSEDWNAKVGSQEILRIIGMFDLGVNQINYILFS